MLDDSNVLICKGCGEKTCAPSRKYCSRECYRSTLRERNIKNNKELNQRKSDFLQESRKENYQAATEAYCSGSRTIADLARDFELPYSALRKYLADKKLTDGKESRKESIRKKFETPLSFLEDENTVKERLASGATSKDIAKEIGVSPDFVNVNLRKLGYPIPRRTFSSYEVKIRNVLDSLGVQYTTSVRDIIAPYELDIFCPEYNIAFEVNGIYWHSDLHKEKDYHKNKTNMCAALGVRLIHIFDYEIDNEFGKIVSLIKSATGKSERIYARKCEIREITSATYKKFLEENHFQGSVNSKIKHGLFFEDEIVAVMGFSKSRYDKSYDYELMRYVSRQNMNVIGGPSKLFKNFTRSISPGSKVCSYANRRLFSGNMYVKLGFNFVRETPPNYFWCDKLGNTLSRYQTQKHKIAPNGDIRTEKDIMTDKGFFRIFDSGQNFYGMVI